MSVNGKNIAVLIVAGGSGTRMNSEIPKQYLTINGTEIIRHTINKFIQISDLDIIQCVISPNHSHLYEQATKNFNLAPVVFGGETRQSSVYKGLQALKIHNPDIVLIHDAARPCLYPQDIHNVINALSTHTHATLALPITETLQKNGDNLDRDNLWMLQTPQAFEFEQILTYHKRAIAHNFTATDDTALANQYGDALTHYVACGRHNIKITTMDDFNMAQKLLQDTMETRVGNGFDVHAFDDSVAESIRLCGIDIPHTKSLKGHSDADVGLHAITDAILGAIAEGDIGTHFPPSNDDFKNMDSHIFLDKAVDILCKKGGKINHLDITFMCENPKIGCHRAEIQSHLAKHLNLSTNRISIKATTTEKLGFTGREEGIACQVIATLQVPAND